MSRDQRSFVSGEDLSVWTSVQVGAYADFLALLSVDNPVVVVDDIVAADGELLLAKGALFDHKNCARLKGNALARSLANSVQLERTIAAEDLLQERPAPRLVTLLRQHLCKRPPLGGFRGNLGTLFPHGGRAGDGLCLQHRSATAGPRRAGDGAIAGSLPCRGRQGPDRALDSAHGGDERDEPCRRPAGLLPLRAHQRDSGKTDLHPRPHKRQRSAAPAVDHCVPIRRPGACADRA